MGVSMIRWAVIDLHVHYWCWEEGVTKHVSGETSFGKGELLELVVSKTEALHSCVRK